MANEGYDKNADQQHNPFGDEKSVNRSGLNHYESQAGKSNSDASDSFGKGRGKGSDGSYYTDDDEQPGRLGQVINRAKSSRDRLGRRVRNNKLLIGAAAGSSTAVIAFLIIGSIFIGADKIIAYAEHVAAYQFARTTAQMAEDTSAIDSEKLSLDSLLSKAAGARGQALYDYFQSKYASAAGPVSDLWSKLDKYRPDIIAQNFHDDGTFKLNTSTTSFGKTYISSVGGSAIGDNPAELQPQSLSNALRNHLIPGYKFATRDVAISRSVAPGLIQELRASDIGPITRARFASSIREQLGVSLTAWQLGKFLGNTDENDAAEQKMSYDYGEGSNPTAPSGPESQYTTAAQAVKNAESTDAQSPTASINSGQMSSDIAQALDKSFPLLAYSTTTGIIKQAVSIINPIYAIATPVCLVYDGSMQKSQGAVDYQSQQAERQAILVQTEAAQEKDGSAVNAQAVGATDWKLGDTNTSNAELRAQGQQVDTSNFVSTEQSGGGKYTYSLADSLPGPLASVANTLGPAACPVITNLWVGAGLGITALLVQPDFSASDGLISSATKAISDFIPRSMQEFGTKVAAAKGSLISFGFKTATTAVGIGAATLYAQQIVARDAGAVHSSLDTSQSYDNTVDDGTNIYANQIEQQQFYGAPLTDANLAQENSQAQEQLVNTNRQQSAYERYFALSNPKSLFSSLAISAGGYLNSSFFSSLLRLCATLLDPLRTIGSILGPWVSHSSFAASTVTSANTFYGNVQFGFTPYEQSLIKNDPSYQPLQNQLYLDQSGQEANIAARYGVCFSESIGTMLANGDVQRRDNGDVIPNQGLCSPSNLGTNNQDDGCDTTQSSRGCYYAGCPNNQCGAQGKGFYDLVFRWRVAQGYNNTLDQLNDEQTVTSPSSPSTPTTSSASTSGYSNPFHDMSALDPSRVDEGADFSTTSSVPIFAIGNGQVAIATSNSSFYPGSWISYKLSDGPAAGQYVYVAEGCSPVMVHPTEIVTSGTQLCNVQPSSIETGWALNGTDQAAAAFGHYIELPDKQSYATQDGQNFTELLYSLGLNVKECYDFPGAALTPPLAGGLPPWVSNPATNSGPNKCPGG